ncbi:5-hydroxytryptamine receptor 2B-like [Crassostrea angulata]|uniref:5-hydroxytryptamine receptor 2B-like n=1 Tax=Magallana angulata TaxID=2784310 RepID=UPI0022B1CD26|nr:5-hydroxytryptamine receptor 2B-like [Crassostrea angulata]
MDNVTFDISQKVKEWNNEIVQSLIPNNTILSMYMVAGFGGNSLVIFIYGFKMKGSKEDRYFIPFLAMADLWASLICASFGIAQNMMQATFDNEQLCKTWYLFAALSTFTSVFFLQIVAVPRYLKVCQPLGRQMTLKWKRFALCMGLTIAFILAVPMTYFYGSDLFFNEELGISGFRCNRLSSVNKTWSLFYGSLILFITITIIVSLICLYSKIGLKIRDHLKRTKINRHHKTVEHSQGNVLNSDDRLSYPERDTQSRDNDDRTEETGFSTTCRDLEAPTKINGGKHEPRTQDLECKKEKTEASRV